jgi:GH35 family endo-1,4-beta-xylanase
MRRYLLAALLAFCGDSLAWGVDGSALQLNSGINSGTNAQLDSNGYAGSYVTLTSQGNLTVTVDATGTPFDGIAPRMNVVLADMKAGFDVSSSGSNAYVHEFENVPAGTYFIRTEFNNDGGTGRALTINSLDVDGATIDTSTSDSALRANALAAADTYIEHFRQGPAKVGLVGVAPGTSVNVRLARHAFNWGANVNGTNTALFSNAQYTDFFKSHFNIVVPSRAGKWNNNESTRDVVTSVTNGYVDAMLDFAEANNLSARMHNLIWANSSGAEQPAWTLNMLNNPSATDPASGTTNLDALRNEISERIDYYVGDGPNGFAELSLRYDEVDIYNESWHTGVNTLDSDANYWDRYGAAGISSIYAEAAQAAAVAGSDARMYVNEYNVFNWGDPYANWYRQHIEDIQNADGNPTNGPVGGIGIQAYLGTGGGGLQPDRVQQAMQTLSVLGLPQSLTEFGVSDSVTDPLVAKDYVHQLMRMVFGHPDMKTFMYWGFWGGGTSSAQGASILVNTDWTLTDIGKMYEDMLGIEDWDDDPTNGWTTYLSLPVGPDGTIDFTGFYGDYELTIDGQTYDLGLTKGDSLYSLVIAPGDYNADGTVNAADYVVWRNTLGSADDLRADGNGDEMIDAGDYDVWKSLFGTNYGSGAGSIATVPEPASVILLAVGLIVTGCRRRCAPASQAG